MRAFKEVNDDFEVWPENWEVLRAFLASSTQWRVVVGMAGGGRTGFDYAGVRAGFKMAKIKLNSDQWNDLIKMELAALEALAEERE